MSSKRFVAPRSLFTTSVFIFFAALLLEAAVLAVLNREMVNNLLFPISQYLPMFSVIWKDNPWAALQIVADKSVLAVGSYDAQSGLYLWTLEFDALSLLLHLLGAMAIANMIARPIQILGWAIAGAVLVALSHTYVTVMAHCAGPTWAGFVSLYGLGVDKFPVNSTWQWLLFVAGVALLITARRLAVSPAARM
jgi:hypothetical protein